MKSDKLLELKNQIKQYPTAVLFDILDEIEKKTRAERTQQERLVAAVVSYVIESRHGLTEAMDSIYEDIYYTGTHTEALKIAYQRKV